MYSLSLDVPLTAPVIARHALYWKLSIFVLESVIEWLIVNDISIVEVE